jgi:hypothetical protein
MKATTGAADGTVVRPCPVHFDPRKESGEYPTPGRFLTQSAESLERKTVEFLMSARKCK